MLGWENQVIIYQWGGNWFGNLSECVKDLEGQTESEITVSMLCKSVIEDATIITLCAEGRSSTTRIWDQLMCVYFLRIHCQRNVEIDQTQEICFSKKESNMISIVIDPGHEACENVIVKPPKRFFNISSTYIKWGLSQGFSITWMCDEFV